MTKRVLFIGARAAGKSTVAAALGFDWVDMDAVVRQRLGFESTAEAFTRAGEPAWRAAEGDVLEALLSDGPPVIAAGGGVGCDTRTGALIAAARDEGQLHVIWLRTSPEEAQRRLEHGAGDRPALTDVRDAALEAAQVMAARAPFYNVLADAVIDADGPPEQVTAAVRQCIVGG